ncbi:MAG: hypothetical protein ACJAQZ_004580 [Planctomycetota bacterium]|jgi:hypothetical protein
MSQAPGTVVEPARSSTNMRTAVPILSETPISTPDSHPTTVKLGGVSFLAVWDGDIRAVFWPSGQVRLKGEFQNGRREGLHEEWHENGQIEAQTAWKNGSRNGRSTHYFDNGIILSQGSYSKGYMDGHWFTNYSNGNLKKEGAWIVDYDHSGRAFQQIKTGKWVHWSLFGKLEEQESGIYEAGERIRGL